MYESVVTTDIDYGTVYNPSFQSMETLKLDMYEPANDPDPLRAVVVWVHGGTFSGGDKSDLMPLGEDFAERGYVVVCPNFRQVRLSGSQTINPAYGAGDVASVARWLRANAATYRIDPARIMLGGSSSGAISGLAAAFDDLVIGLNMNHWGYSSRFQALCEISGRLVRINELDSTDPPFLIVHGLRDPSILIQHAIDLANRADAVGVHHEELIFPQAGHGILNSHYDLITPVARNFFFRHVIR
ncbi:MAG: alpha/beta hydrolase [Planctomycetes bacterium]|nr:alpha/beta hydrolase [Planctomycetota bacterium]MCP4772335.1 alpha/beta hydrolase [Planctomycetota bacterium]MCP4861565.1 alpha/beta hydrolase [Planctomycetota bacterium]